MTTIYEYIASVKARGVTIEVTHLGTLRVMPELIDWEDRRDVLEFLGLRKQVARCLIYSEDHLIDAHDRDRHVRALKVLVGGRIRESKYQEALGTLDEDAAAETAHRDAHRARHEEQEAANFIGACIGEDLGIEVRVPTLDRQLIARKRECKRLGIDFRSVEWDD